MIATAEFICITYSHIPERECVCGSLPVFCHMGVYVC